MGEARICNRCVMDSTDSTIEFNEYGFCNHCMNAWKLLKELPQNQLVFPQVIDSIKEAGKNKKYDCVIGLSGGTDSSTVLHKLKIYGLRPIVVVYNNGWDTEISKSNRVKLIRGTGFDTEETTENIEFLDLQKAFFKASVPDVEVTTDHAMVSALYDASEKYGVKTLIMGSNLITESIRTRGWSRGHYDWKYINGVYKIFTGKNLKHVKHRSRARHWYLTKIKKIWRFPILDYIVYDPVASRAMLEDEYGWEDYHGKHCESVITRFVTLYYIAKKFGFDKRKANYSSLIMSELMSRRNALELLKEPAWEYSKAKEDLNMVKARLRFTDREWTDIMSAPNKSYWDYPHYRRTPDPRRSKS